MTVKVRVEDLILDIERTKSEIETATGNRARDLRRHLGFFERVCVHLVAVPCKEGTEQDGSPVSADNGKSHAHHLRKLSYSP